MAQGLAELGNVLPCISVEGFEKETDTRRGNGHFEKVVTAMDNLRDGGWVEPLLISKWLAVDGLLHKRDFLR